jgi:hypothetical protein
MSAKNSRTDQSKSPKRPLSADADPCDDSVRRLIAKSDELIATSNELTEKLKSLAKTDGTERDPGELDTRKPRNQIKNS